MERRDDKEDDSAPWGIGHRINQPQKTRRGKQRDAPPPADRTYGAPTPAFDGVGMQGQYLRGAPAGPKPQTAPERPWALDPEAQDMFAEAEKQREAEKARADFMRSYHTQQQQQEQQAQGEQRRPKVSWAQENDEEELIEPSWHDSYAGQPYYPEDLDDSPEELVQEPLSPDDSRDDTGDDEALGKTGRVLIQPDGRRVWGPVQSIPAGHSEQQQQQRLDTARAKAKANEAAVRAQSRQAERDQKAREEHERRMRTAVVKASRDSSKQPAAKKKAGKGPWRPTASKPYDTFPNPYDNGPRWRESLRQLDDIDPPSRDILERRAAEQRRAASAERRARRRADQSEWEAPAAGPPEPNPYEDPVAWVETLRDAAGAATAAGMSASGRGAGVPKVAQMQPTSQFRRSVEAESKIAAQVRADKELYKARLKQARRDQWHSGGFPDEPVPPEFYDPAGLEAAAATAAGPVGQIETMWADAAAAAHAGARGAGNDDDSDLPPWKLVEKYLPEHYGRGNDDGYSYAAAHGRGDRVYTGSGGLYPAAPAHLYPGGQTVAPQSGSRERDQDAAQTAARLGSLQVSPPTVAGGETGHKTADATQPQPQLYQEQAQPSTSLYPVAARLRTDAARMRHAADSEAAYTAQDAADSRDGWAAREDRGKQGEAAQRAASEMATIAPATEEEFSEDALPVVRRDSGAVEAPPVLTSNDLDSMEARMRSLQESINQGHEQPGETSEEDEEAAAPAPSESPAAATAPPPLLAARARAAAAVIDLDSSIETAAADESFTGSAAVLRDRIGADSDSDLDDSAAAQYDTVVNDSAAAEQPSPQAVDRRDAGAKVADATSSLQSRTLSMSASTTNTEKERDRELAEQAAADSANRLESRTMAMAAASAAAAADSDGLVDHSGQQGGVVPGPVIFAPSHDT